METRANYVLIGAVTIMAMLGALGFFLWLAKVQIDRTYSYYDILFDSAAGLGKSSPVRFNGVDVGQVLSIELDRADPSRVRVSIQVGAGTPIRQGTEATLESQGVTGVSFVGLEGGTSDAPLLMPDTDTGVALIPSKQSVVQGLIATAPDLLQQAIGRLKDLGKFTNAENQKSIANILKNVDAATGRLDSAMTDFAKISDSIAKVVDQVAAFTTKLDTVVANANGALDTADSTLETYRSFGEGLPKVADSADAALRTANETLQGISRFSNEALPRLTAAVGDAQRLIDALNRLTTQIARDPARFFLGNRTPEYNR